MAFPRRVPVRAFQPPPPLEHAEQSVFFQWAMLNHAQFPGLENLFAVPNGGYKLGKALAALFKRTGLRTGVPDLVLPVARFPFHGLYIEMKRVGSPPSATSKEQRDWRAALRAQGYASVEAHGDQEAREAVEWYYGLPTWAEHFSARAVELLAERDERVRHRRSERKMRTKVSITTGVASRDH
jgi:hypothetical protein